MAIAAHPDDIEFYMAGTLTLLRRAGWTLHCFNVSCGNLGSKSLPGTRLAAQRRKEARQAARCLDATWHPPIRRDLEIFYDDRTLRDIAAILRTVNPSILLTHSPQDYMEDHTNTCRLAVTAAFARGFPNYKTRPACPPVDGDIVVYHAMPHLLRDPLGQPVRPDFFINTESVMTDKREALSAHRSQKEWLDATQGMDSYLRTMEDLSRTVGRMSGTFRHAEGWRRHLHAGFCSPKADPLKAVLKRHYAAHR